MKFNSRKANKARGQKSPTSLSSEADKSPQLQHQGQIVLNNYTSKNVMVGTFPNLYNTIANNRLAYRRAARGGDPDDMAKLRLGPKIFNVTKKNYKNLKKGQQIYLDRHSIYFRGPFTFQRFSRGPKLNFTARDAGYDKTYSFTFDPNKLDKILLYAKTTIKRKTIRRKTIRRKTTRKRRRKSRRRKSKRRH